MSVRTRVEMLERRRSSMLHARDMTDDDLEAIVRDWFGHNPSDEELLALVTSNGADPCEP